MISVSFRQIYFLKYYEIVCNFNYCEVWIISISMTNVLFVFICFTLAIRACDWKGQRPEPKQQLQFVSVPPEARVNPHRLLY